MKQNLFSREQFDESARFVLARTDLRPRVALTLGSGLNPLANALTDTVTIPYGNIPHFPVSTVVGHFGIMVVGKLNNRPVVALKGRVHYYEGYDYQEVTYYVRVLRAMGVDTIILTNAAGGLNRSFRVGDLMLIADHVFLPGLVGSSPLRGPNDNVLGPRFPEMGAAYDPALRRLAHQVAGQLGITLQEGVYVSLGGPSFETPAEVRFLRTIGDAVGMSTAPETIVARHGGMRVLGISMITNIAVDSVTVVEKPTHEEVLEVGQEMAPRLTELLSGIVTAM